MSLAVLCKGAAHSQNCETDLCCVEPSCPFALVFCQFDVTSCVLLLIVASSCQAGQAGLAQALTDTCNTWSHRIRPELSENNGTTTNLLKWKRRLQLAHPSPPLQTPRIAPEFPGMPRNSPENPLNNVACYANLSAKPFRAARAKTLISPDCTHFCAKF